MAEQPDPTRTTDGARRGTMTTDAVLVVIAAEGPHGATTDRVARAIKLKPDVEMLQDILEELAEQGVLDRRGIGHGAVYTLNAMS